MLTLGTLSRVLASANCITGLSLGKLLHFLRLTASLKSVILHSQTYKWKLGATPATLPARIHFFLACRLDLSDQELDTLWTTFGKLVWQHGSELLDDQDYDGAREECGEPDIRLEWFELECNTGMFSNVLSQLWTYISDLHDYPS